MSRYSPILAPRQCPGTRPTFAVIRNQHILFLMPGAPLVGKLGSRILLRGGQESGKKVFFYFYFLPISRIKSMIRLGILSSEGTFLNKIEFIVNRIERVG